MQKRANEIKYSPKFLKHLSQLPARIIREAQTKEILFKEDIFNPRLKTHKLHGKDKDCWGFWIDYTYRIKFCFLEIDEVLFLDIGTHDIYSK